MATHVRLDAILQCQRPLSIALFSVVGLIVILTLGSCSSPVASSRSGAETAPTHTADSPGTGPTTDASETTTASESAVTTYKPATAQGPAENVPLPVVPELARQASSTGLQEFARYWYSLINYGFETGDPGPIQQISAPECVLCIRIYDMLEDGYHEDDWIVNGQIDVLGTQSNYVQTNQNTYQVLIQVKQDQFEYRGPNNIVYEVVDGFGSATVHMIEATYANHQWFVTNAVIMQSAP